MTHCGKGANAQPGDCIYNRPMNKESIDFLKACEPAFTEHIDKIGPIELPAAKIRDPFIALMRSITYQQLAGAAAGAIWTRLQELFADEKPTPELLRLLSDEQLRGAGLSRSKIRAMRDIAQKAAAGIVPSARSISRMSEAVIYERLTQIRGVGNWTVEMVLIFTLRRPDVMPATDYAIRKGIQVLFRKRNLPTPRQIEKLTARWRPHRTTAALYLWRIAAASKPTRRKAATS